MTRDPSSPRPFRASRSARRATCAALLSAGLASACATQLDINSSGDAGAKEASVNQYVSTPADYGAFELKDEPELPCVKAEHVDVNLGNAPEVFVQATYCQVTGKPADDKTVYEWVQKLRTDRYTRRIDVVKSVCLEAQRECTLVYSDPWKTQVELSGAPEKKVKRDVGAVFMFFFNCPGDVNCRTSWANTHVPGMIEKSPLYGFGDKKEDFYDPKNTGFWYRELLDAQWAGLDFIMPNVYGPDIEDGKLGVLQEALEAIDKPPKIAMFDDSWTWGEPWFSKFWEQRPDFNKVDEAAQTIFDAKWKPFFSQVGKKHWYRFKGRPFIYIYNAGKLNPRSNAGPVYAKMRELFQAEFGEDPFIMSDSAFLDDPRMADVADSKFRWFTFQLPGKRSHEEMNGHIIDHAMVRWDSIGREHDRPAKPGDLLFKDGRVLQKVLDETRDSEMLVLATWNDLGEGTGVNRNYDYYDNGQWLAPNHFMKMIRDSQSGK